MSSPLRSVTHAKGLISDTSQVLSVAVAQVDDKLELDNVEAARAGDVEAVGWLYEQYSDRIYSYVYVRLGNHAEAEDVTSQIFLKMVEKIGEYKRQGSGFPAWLFRIAHNGVIDAQRKSYRRRYVPIDQEGLYLPSTGADPYQQAERRDFIMHVRECVSQLSQLQAQVIMLKYAGELSNPEISQVISRSPNAVNSLHYEALKKLEKLLTQKGYTY